jgi:hypothetical protein
MICGYGVLIECRLRGYNRSIARVACPNAKIPAINPKRNCPGIQPTVGNQLLRAWVVFWLWSTECCTDHACYQLQFSCKIKCKATHALRTAVWLRSTGRRVKTPHICILGTRRKWAVNFTAPFTLRKQTITPRNCRLCGSKIITVPTDNLFDYKKLPPAWRLLLYR